MIKRVAQILAALVVVGACASAYSAFTRSQEWEGRARSALQQAGRALDAAEAASAREAELAAANDSLVSALEVERRRVRERVVVERAREEVPDSCAVFTAWRDEVIDDLIAEAESWRGAWQTEREARAELRTAYNELERSHDALTQVLQDRPTARASFWDALVPDVTVGVFGGVNANARPTYGVGVMIGWRIF